MSDASVYGVVFSNLGGLILCVGNKSECYQSMFISPWYNDMRILSWCCCCNLQLDVLHDLDDVVQRMHLHLDS